MARRQNRTDYHKKWHEEHRNEINERHREVYDLKKPQVLARQKDYYESHKAEVSKRHRKYREAHKDEILVYRQAHKDEARIYRQKHKEKIRLQMHEWNERLRSKFLDIYGRKCTCPCGCPESFEPFLTVGHVLNDGKLDRAQHGGYHGVLKRAIEHPDHARYGTRCWNCNLAADKNGGVCPKSEVLKRSQRSGPGMS